MSNVTLKVLLKVLVFLTAVGAALISIISIAFR